MSRNFFAETMNLTWVGGLVQFHQKYTSLNSMWWVNAVGASWLNSNQFQWSRAIWRKSEGFPRYVFNIHNISQEDESYMYVFSKPQPGIQGVQTASNHWLAIWILRALNPSLPNPQIPGLRMCILQSFRSKEAILWTYVGGHWWQLCSHWWI